MKTEHLGTWILDYAGPTKGTLKVEDGRVTEIIRGAAPTGSTYGIVAPSFINSHTHLGDSFAYPAPRGTLEETVAPPYGYKHKALRSASRESKVAGMREAAKTMLASGTSSFIDFREEGVDGIHQLREALGSLEGPPTAVILGRPAAGDAPEREFSPILEVSDGLGMSAVRDWPLGQMEEASRSAKSAGKRFALHASEAVREDIEDVLRLKPDFIVHMSSASDSDLQACAQARVPIVVCPRSNEFFGIDLDIPRMMRAEVELGLGTDNGMITRPDMIEETKAAYRIGRREGRLTPLDVVRLATFGGRKVLNAPAKITPEIGISDDLMVVMLRGERDPLLELCTTSVAGDVVAMVQGGRVRRSGAWR